MSSSASRSGVRDDAAEWSDSEVATILYTNNRLRRLLPLPKMDRQDLIPIAQKHRISLIENIACRNALTSRRS